MLNNIVMENIELKIGLRFYMFGNKTNSFRVINFDNKSMFLYSELLCKNMPKPYKRDQFISMVESGEIEFFE